MSGDIRRGSIEIVRSSGGITRGVSDISRGGDKNKPRDGFRELFDDEADALEIEETGDLQEDMDNAVSSVAAQIAANRKRSEQDYALMDDEKFYFCVVFQTEAQKLDFLAKVGWLNTMEYDNFDNMYLNGLEVARRLGVDLDVIVLPEIDIRGNPDKYKNDIIRKRGGDSNG